MIVRVSARSPPTITAGLPAGLTNVRSVVLCLPVGDFPVSGPLRQIVGCLVGEVTRVALRVRVC